MLTLQKKYALVISPDRGPCAYVRWRQWQHLIDSSMGGECYLLVMDEPIYDEYLLSHTAVVVFARPFQEHQFSQIKHYAKLKNKFKFKLAIDLDDLLFDIDGKDTIPEYNPHPIDTIEVGKRYEEIVPLLDRVFCSTDFLAYAFCVRFGRSLVEKVDVLPNFCFTSLAWDEHRPTRKKHIDVFYAGSCCHYKEGMQGDFEGPWLEGIGLSMERGYIKFHAFGEDPGIFPRGTILHEQVHASLWLSTISHYAPDVLIAPLKNHPFNKAKSNLKGLEASAVGAAFVASIFPGSPYNSITPQLTGVLDRTTPDDIMRMFDALRDPVLRKACVRTTRHLVAQQGLVAEMKQGTDRFIHTLFKGFLE